MTHTVIGGRQKEPGSHSMLTRTSTTSLAGRASSMRRLRRRAGTTATHRPYCATNGCTSFLDVDTDAGIAVCPICGYTRRMH
jgi:hypothetical protein